jgi:CDP-4-dehydro-6-deoxyglucose reductase
MNYNITVEPSGRRFAVERGEPILAAGIRHGVDLPYGCRDGACGACKCRKLDGSVVHGPHELTALSSEESAAGYVLTCCAIAQTDVVLESRQVTSVSAAPVRKLSSRIARLKKVSHDVMLVRLQLLSDESMAYQAGQYLDFVLGDGVRRSYSIANAPHNGPGVELHIRHMAGGKFTERLFNTMKEQEILRIEGPYGNFFLREVSSKPILLLASGTGFAPIKALIEYLKFRHIARPATLYWGGRRPVDLYMNDWVLEQVTQIQNLSYVPVISHARPEDHWCGRTGLVHKALMQDFPDLSGCQVYACGAPSIVAAAQADYTTFCKLSPDEFYADSFVTEADKVQSSPGHDSLHGQPELA